MSQTASKPVASRATRRRARTSAATASPHGRLHRGRARLLVAAAAAALRGRRYVHREEPAPVPARRAG
jgi:hypothetical protein